MDQRISTFMGQVTPISIYWSFLSAADFGLQKGAAIVPTARPEFLLKLNGLGLVLSTKRPENEILGPLQVFSRLI